MNLELRHHRLAPLVTVTVAALIFAILLIAVRLQWAPLESADHGAAASINSLVAGSATLVSVVKAVTFLGSNGVLWTVIVAATVILAIRRRWRLAAYLLVTGAGALTLDPILKSLVGRLRPVVAHPIAHGTGDSFPSGHSLGSIVCYGAILLVFLPAARGRWRTAFVTVIITLIALIGISRILLGVHYLSDVVGAWAVGITWLGITALAFELSRSAAGRFSLTLCRNRTGSIDISPASIPLKRNENAQQPAIIHRSFMPRPCRPDLPCRLSFRAPAP